MRALILFRILTGLAVLAAAVAWRGPVAAAEPEPPDLLTELLQLTAGHVIFDMSQPPGAGVVASVTCARWYLDPLTGSTTCPDQVWIMRTGGRMPLLRRTRTQDALFVHELAHVYDGMDDGKLNGSPGYPGPMVAPARVQTMGMTPVSHCLENRAEWYACSVAFTGRLG